MPSRISHHPSHLLEIRMPGYVIPYDLTVMEIHLGLAPFKLEFRHVGHEDLVRCIDSELSLEKVVRDFPDSSHVGTVFPSFLCRFPLQSKLLHDPLDHFVIDWMVFAAQ